MTPILAIDPGTEQSAWVHLVEGKIVSHGISPNEAVLDMLDLWSWNGCYPILAVEMIASYGMPVGREVFETCVWIGRFVQAWQPGEFAYVYRQEVKLHLCGTIKGVKDSNIRQALLDLYGVQGTKKAPGPTHRLKADEWAALGVAETMRDRLARKAA